MSDAVGISGGTLQETLERLSRKPGVAATIALERSTGAIIKTTGQFAAFRRASAAATAPSFSATTNGPGAADDGAMTSESQTGADELAAMVWKFVQSTGELVAGLDTEDEVKLLRLRTKKHELVIVPDMKYLLIVVHETAPA